jgi:hypothetical protein
LPRSDRYGFAVATWREHHLDDAGLDLPDEVETLLREERAARRARIGPTHSRQPVHRWAGKQSMLVATAVLFALVLAGLLGVAGVFAAH